MSTSLKTMARTSVWVNLTRMFLEERMFAYKAIRVSGEGVGLLESTFKVTGYCLQQFAFVGLHHCPMTG